MQLQQAFNLQDVNADKKHTAMSVLYSGMMLHFVQLSCLLQQWGCIGNKDIFTITFTTTPHGGVIANTCGLICPTTTGLPAPSSKQGNTSTKLKNMAPMMSDGDEPLLPTTRETKPVAPSGATGTAKEPTDANNGNREPGHDL